MDDAPTWTLIGGFLAVTVFASSLLLRVVRAEIGSVRGDMATLATERRGEMAATSTKIDSLDRDVQDVSDRQLGGRPDPV